MRHHHREVDVRIQELRLNEAPLQYVDAKDAEQPTRVVAGSDRGGKRVHLRHVEGRHETLVPSQLRGRIVNGTLAA